MNGNRTPVRRVASRPAPVFALSAALALFVSSFAIWPASAGAAASSAPRRAAVMSSAAAGRSAKPKPSMGAAGKRCGAAATHAPAGRPSKPASASGLPYPYALKRPETVPITPLRFDPPEPRRETLPNGMVVYLMEDHALPIFRMAAYTKVGSIHAPVEKAGIAGMTGSVMRTGGTESLTGDEIDRRLEMVGATVETSISRENASASATSLAKDRRLVIDLLAGILRRPAFREDKIELARGQILEAIRRQNDDPNDIASREFPRLVFGPESPWASVPTLASVKGITRDDLIEFHRRFFRPNNTFVAVAGDFRAGEVLDDLKAAFGDWEREEIHYPAIEPLREIERGRLVVLPRDLPQTVVWMGHLGMRRHSPDYPAVMVMNQILGSSGFTSRLMREVRSNRGLAYSVDGAVTPLPDRGMFYAAAQTKTESASEAAAVMRKVIEEMTARPVSEEEVRLAKESIINSHVFQFDSPFEIVNQRARLEMLGYPANHLRTFPERVRKVTPAMVTAAAKRYLHPDRMVMLFVGKTDGLTPPITTFGAAEPLTLDPVE